MVYYSSQDPRLTDNTNHFSPTPAAQILSPPKTESPKQPVYLREKPKVHHYENNSKRSSLLGDLSIGKGVKVVHTKQKEYGDYSRLEKLLQIRRQERQAANAKELAIKEKCDKG